MNENDDDAAAARNSAICARVLNDTIASLAVKFGVDPVVAALTEVVGCHACVTGPVRKDAMRELIERMGKADPQT